MINDSLSLKPLDDVLSPYENLILDKDVIVEVTNEEMLEWCNRRRLKLPNIRVVYTPPLLPTTAEVALSSSTFVMTPSSGYLGQLVM